jgi:uncharacterized protein with beta-barrel porin domain
MPRILGSSKKTLMFYLLGQAALTGTIRAANEEVICNNNNSYYLSRISNNYNSNFVSSGIADSVNIFAQNTLSAIKIIPGSPVTAFYILGDGLVFYGPGVDSDHNFDAGYIIASTRSAIKFSLIDPAFNYSLYNGGGISGNIHEAVITAANLQTPSPAKISIFNGYTYPRSLDRIAPPNFVFPPDTAAPQYSGTITAKSGQRAIDFWNSNVGLELTQNNNSAINGTIFGGKSKDTYNINGGTITRSSSIEAVSLGDGEKTINVTGGIISGISTDNLDNNNVHSAAFSGLALQSTDLVTFNVSGGRIENNAIYGRGAINIYAGVAPIIFNISGGTIINTNTPDLKNAISILDEINKQPTGITTLNITNSPTITGHIALPAIENVLNIGINAAPGITAQSANFSTGGKIINAQIINVNNTTGNGFTINYDVTGIKTFTVSANTTTTIAGGKVSGIDANVVLSNAGNVTMKQTGILDMPFNFSKTNGAVLTLEGGSILKPVTGNLEVDNTIKATGDFGTSNTIDKVGTIEVAGIGDNIGVFKINNSITNLDTRFDNKSNGMIIVNNGGNISGKATLINSGVLTLNNGGIVNTPVTFGTNGGVINMAGGTISSLVTGTNSNNEIINILKDCTTSGSLSKIQNVGNLLVDTNNFTINSQIKGISYNFGNAYHSTTNIISGGDVSGGGAISNAGIIAVNGGTIGSDARMGNVINSGTIDVAGNVNVRAFTNGIAHPVSAGPLTAINTIDIIYKAKPDPSGNQSTTSEEDNPPTVTNQKIIEIEVNDNVPLQSVTFNNQQIKIEDPDSKETQETVMLMATNGVLKILSSYVKPSDVIIFGQGTPTITVTGTLSQLQTVLNNLEFTPTFPKYGRGNITVIINDNNNQSGSTNSGLKSSDGNGSIAGKLNITSGNVVTENVTNELGTINISGGDLSSFLVNANNITNNSGQTITVSDSGKIGNTKSFNKILNYGIFNVTGESATVKASAIELYKNSKDTDVNSGTMTTSGTINAPINFKDGNVTLNIRGGAINEVITGSTNNADSSTINILGTFTTKKSINNVRNINVTKDDNGVGNFTINNAITGVDIKFYTNEGTITKINQNATQTGSISGLGVIENNGTLTLAGDAVTNGDILGSFSVPMGNVTNKGVFNIGAGKAYIGDFANNSNTALLNITGGTLQTKHINNTLGKITISGGDLSGLNNTINLTNAPNQTIEILDKGSLGATLAFSNVNNNGIINLTTSKLFAANLNNNADGVININNNGILNNTSVTGNLVNSGLINLNPGGTIGMPVIFGNQGGIVNFAGGSATRIIGGTGNVNGKGIAKISVDLAYDGVHNPIISNIAAINVASGNFSVNGLINGLNEYFSIDKDAITTVNQNGNISGNIYLTNSGTLTINSGGAINVPIRFGADGGILNLSGGSANKTIGGPDSSGKGTINLNGDFTYNDVSPNISNIENFNVNAGKFNVNDSITKIKTAFSVANNATVFINSKGSLSGDGEIYNSGTINLDSGTIGTNSDNIGGIVNTGTINVNNNIYIKNNIQNNNEAAGQASSALVTTTGIYAISNQATTPTDKLNLGHIVINNNGKIWGTTSGANPSTIYNSGEITLNSGGEINIPINFGESNSGILNLAGGSFLANITGNNTGTININKNFTYDGARTITNVNTINVNSPFKFLVTNSTVGSDTFNNTGTIKLTGGTISGTQINHDAGYLIINGGAINSAINVRSDLAQVTINGGAINGNITGYDGGNTVININNNFTTGGAISKINVININQNTFNINHALSDNGSLNTLYETTAQINTGGSISGPGYINNLGTVKLAGGTSSINKIYNNGIFIVENNGHITDGNFINSKFLGSGNNNSIIDPFTVYGNIDINVTQTALSINLNDQSLTKSIPGTQTVAQNNNIIFSSATKNAIVIDGIDRNGGTLKLIATHGTLTVPNTTQLTGISGNNSGIVYLSGSLDKLNNSLQGLVFSPELNYVGSGAKLQIVVHNNRLVTSEEIIDNDQFVATTPNIPESYIPILNIGPGGIASPASIENNFGKINISGGDLSSVSNTKASTLLNGAGQTITISDAGTIGANQALGTVTNNGIINAGGGAIKITEFINNNINAALNITNNTIKITNLNNSLGTINISNGDLSGLDANSNITNFRDQNINISGTGTIGANNGSSVVTITNNGIINANGGNIKTNNINNFGIINANGGSISCANFVNNSLININANFTAYGNIVNNINAVTNLGANTTLTMDPSNTFTNHGVLHVLNSATLTNVNYIISSTGIHLVTINNNNNNILTLQNSTVNFNANSTISFNHSDDYLIKDNQKYTIITANNPNNIILNSSNVKVTGSTELISYTANKVDNNVEVIAKRNLIEGVVKTVGNLGATPLAKVLDNLVATGVTGDLRTALIKLDGLLTEQEVNDAVNQLMPETNITPEVSFAPPAMVFSAVGERFDLIARAGITNVKTGYSAGSMQASNNLWLKGFGGVVDQKQRTIFPGYKANSAGVAFGLDDQVLENTWLGIGFSSVNTHVNSQDGSSRKTKVASRQVTFYGSYSPEYYYLDAFIATAFNNYKISRGIKYNGLNYTATADYNSVQPSAKISGGIVWDFYNDFKLIPNLSLQYSVLRYNTYNETGAGGLSLQKVTSKDLEQLEGGLGVKFSWVQKENEQIYNPYLHITMLHDFKSSAQVTTAQFLGGGGTFTIQGAPYDKKTYNIGAGLTIVNQNRLNCTINYDLKKKNKFIGHTGYIAVKYAF